MKISVVPCCTALFVIAALWPIAVVAESIELTGSAFTVMYRGPTGQTPPTPEPALRRSYQMPTARPQGLRLLNGRTGQELARAEFDTRLNGYMFALPLAAQGPVAPICLVLKNSVGRSLPVRDERPGDDGYAFRNPLWEAELSRAGELQQLQAELQQLEKQLATERAELQKLQAETAPGKACALGPAVAEPARPLQALNPSEAIAAAGGFCALRWEAAFAESRIDLERLFTEAGLSADWAQRVNYRAATSVWQALRLQLTSSDATLVRDAATRGRAFLEHGEGLKVLARAHQACRTQVPELAATALRAWEGERQAAAEAPQRALQACQARQIRIDTLTRAHTAAPAYREQLTRRIEQLRISGGQSTQTRRLDELPCRDL